MIHQEAFEIFAAELNASSGGKIAPATTRTQGTSSYWVGQAVASCMTELSHQFEESYAGHFVDLAQGDALQELGHDHFNLQIQGATASVVECTFGRTTTTGDATFSAGSIVRTASGVRFTLDDDVEMAAGVSSASGTMTSVLAGADQRVEAGELTIFVTTPPAADWTVTNADDAAGANDQESDEDFRGRIRERDEAAPATLAGIRRGAIEDVPQVREAAAYEDLDAQGRQTGHVTLVIGDDDGESNATLTSAVDTAQDDWRPAGVPVTVTGASVVWQDIAVTVTWEPTAATQAAKLAVRDAIVAVVNRLDPNGAATAAEAPAGALLTTGLIEHAARTVAGVVDVAVSVPSGTVAPANGELIRTSKGRVTVS